MTTTESEAKSSNAASVRAVVADLAPRRVALPLASPTGDPLDLAPPKLRTTAECSAALEKVAEAMCDGRVDAATGKVLVDVISTQAKLLEVTDLEARLIELEKAPATVDLPGSRRRS